MSNAAAILRPNATSRGDLGMPIELDEYQQFTRRTDKNETPGEGGIPFALLGLFGETGSLLSELKKKQRDKDSYVSYHDSVLEELGDVLWYFTNTTFRLGFNLSFIARGFSDTRDGASAISFVELQGSRKCFTGPLSGHAVESRLITMGAKVGRLLEDFTAGKIADNKDALADDLVEIFRAIVAAANDADVSLDEAVQRNIMKVVSRWPLSKTFGPRYDDDCDSDERLPQRLEVVFREKDIAGTKYVIQECNGIHIGDRLTDNRFDQDDYRFHDVFHLAYAAVLGWSPVLRALFKLKRKSRPAVDENEDGARAILIEEGISTWIFNHAASLYHFRSVEHLDYSLLKSIRDFVKGYEVETRPLWQWEHAILEGFRVFRELQVYRGGTVVADLDNHTITFHPADNTERI